MIAYWLYVYSSLHTSNSLIPLGKKSLGLCMLFVILIMTDTLFAFLRNAPIYFQLVELANLLMNLESIFLAVSHLIR